ncbi:hypothetical protein JHK86_003942 [Glycine max]|nr:hypothetical protein JHK86_003942 [Glycine max]
MENKESNVTMKSKFVSYRDRWNVGRAYHIDRISELSIDVIGIILQRLSHEEVKAENLTDLSLVADTHGNNFERKTISNLLKALSKMENIYLGEGYVKSHSKSMVVGLPLTLEESTYDSCCFSQLLNVNIIVKVAYKNTLNFIQFLLAHSPSLEILCFKVIHLRQDHYSRPRLFRDLKRMERASEAVQVVFIYISDSHSDNDNSDIDGVDSDSDDESDVMMITVVTYVLKDCVVSELPVCSLKKGKETHANIL